MKFHITLTSKDGKMNEVWWNLSISFKNWFTVKPMTSMRLKLKLKVLLSNQIRDGKSYWIITISSLIGWKKSSRKLGISLISSSFNKISTKWKTPSTMPRMTRLFSKTLMTIWIVKYKGWQVQVRRTRETLWRTQTCLKDYKVFRARWAQ